MDADGEVVPPNGMPNAAVVVAQSNHRDEGSSKCLLLV